MSFSPPTDDGKDENMSSPAPTPVSPSSSPPTIRSLHPGAHFPIGATCKHLADRTTTSLSTTTHSLEIARLCRLCGLRESISMAAYLWHRTESIWPPFGATGNPAFKSWREARAALANHLFDVVGTDGCSADDEERYRIEKARLKAVNLTADVFKEKVEVDERRFRSIAATAAAAAALKKHELKRRRRPTHVVAGGDDKVKIEFGKPTLHANRVTGLPTPGPTGNINTTPTISDLPKPPRTILKLPTTTTATIPTEPPFLDLNLDFMSISLTPDTNNSKLRSVTFHPTAMVQDFPTPYAYPHRAETEYRHMGFYYRPNPEWYVPKQWAVESDSLASDPAAGDPSSPSVREGKKRQREEEDDDHDSEDQRFKKFVRLLEECGEPGEAGRLRSRKS